MKNFRITVNGNSYDVAVEELGGSAPVSAPAPVQQASPSAPAAKPAASSKAKVAGTKVTAPMPGKITGVKTAVGTTVKKGDLLVTLEAMKMENEILAPVDGKVDVIQVSKGSNVESGDLLLSIV